MDRSFYPDNPIAFAQFRLRGGWRNLAWTGGAYTLLIFVLMTGSHTLASLGMRATYNSWVTILLGLQVAILLFFGSTNVTSAIRNDRTNGMIESHRLMPTSAASAILGYLLGSPCQAFVVVAANFILGIFAIAESGMPLDLWVAANAVVLWFSLCLWSVMAVLAFGAKGAALLIYLPLSSVWFSQGMSIDLLPGLAVLASPTAGNSIFGWTVSARSAPYPFMVGALAQGFFAGICFAGACRKYRRPDAPPFTPFMGLLMLGGWVAVSLIGIRQWDLFRPRFIPGQVDLITQLVASITLCMLLALMPIGAAVLADTDWRRRQRLNDPALGRRPIAVLLVVLLATAIVLALSYVDTHGTRQFGTRLAWLAAVIAAALLCPAFLLRICMRGGSRGIFIVSSWVILTWAAPVLGELMMRTFSADPRSLEGFPGPIACVSPPTAIYRLLQGVSEPAQSALLVHGAVAFALAALFYRPIRHDRRAIA